jgi:anion-transporting  ArsA/GET3 family ATPase
MVPRNRMRDLLAKPLLVVTGKGGVGKSTVATALGLAAAQAGRRTIVAEVGGRDDVALGLTGEQSSSSRGFVERTVDEAGLQHISIDPESALEEYLRDQLPRGVAELMASSRTFSLLAAATPGLRELLTVGKVWELAQPDRRTPGAHPYDLVILDAPATGHGVATLTAPGTFAETARVGPIARQGQKIHEMLSDPEQTAVVAVTTAEELPVNETIGLQTSLMEQLGQRLAAVVVNGVLPRRFTAAEVRALEALGADPAAAVARAHATRSRAQRSQLARLRRNLPAVAVHTLGPLAATGPAQLRALGRELTR